jgi:hypothetical protein
MVAAGVEPYRIRPQRFFQDFIRVDSMLPRVTKMLPFPPQTESRPGIFSASAAQQRRAIGVLVGGFEALGVS